MTDFLVDAKIQFRWIKVRVPLQMVSDPNGDNINIWTLDF